MIAKITEKQSNKLLNMVIQVVINYLNLRRTIKWLPIYLDHYYRKFFSKMGNDQSKQILGAIRNWKQLTAKRAEIQGSPSLVQDQKSFEVADCYDIPLHHQLNYQLKLMINHRNIKDLTVIKLIDAKIKEKTILQCGAMDVLQVYTEPISCRLEDVCLSDLENLVIVQEVLRASQVLLTLTENYFMINAKMIGFTENGKTKMWFNEHFGKHLIDQKALLRNEQDMVRGIISVFANEMSRKFDFFQAVTFTQALSYLEIHLKLINKALVQSQILYKIKKRQMSKSSSKKLSVSEKSISEIKNKGNPNHRSSIDISLEKINQLTSSKVLTSKQNLIDFRNTDLAKSLPVKHSKIIVKKKVDLSASIKISLADNPMCSVASFSSTFPPRMSVPYPQKPIIRIHYQKNVISQNHHNECKSDNSFTYFPKEQLVIPHVTCKSINKASLLRHNYRRCSEIAERSEEGEDTQSQISQHINDQSCNSSSKPFDQKWGLQNSNFTNPFWQDSESWSLQM